MDVGGATARLDVRLRNGEVTYLWEGSREDLTRMYLTALEKSAAMDGGMTPERLRDAARKELTIEVHPLGLVVQHPGNGSGLAKLVDIQDAVIHILASAPSTWCWRPWTRGSACPRTRPPLWKDFFAKSPPVQTPSGWPKRRWTTSPPSGWTSSPPRCKVVSTVPQTFRRGSIPGTKTPGPLQGLLWWNGALPGPALSPARTYRAGLSHARTALALALPLCMPVCMCATLVL